MKNTGKNGVFYFLYCFCQLICSTINIIPNYTLKEVRKC